MLPFSGKYLSDEFEFRKAALIRIAAPLDFTNETAVNGFEISGTEPEGTRRRIIFEIDGALYKFGSNGLDDYEGLGALPDILARGNTVAELLALNDVPQFVGKKIFPIIALDAPADAPVFPKIKIAAKVQSFNDIYTCFHYSPEYQLSGAAKVINVQANKILRGNGAAKVEGRMRGVNGWGDWLDIDEMRYKAANAIQFRVQFILSAIDGSDGAAVTDVSADYTTDANKLPGAQEIISLPQEYNADLATCYALICHSRLIDCQLRAFVKFDNQLIERSNVPLDPQQPFLAFNGVADSGINQDSLHVENNSIPVDAFFYDTQSAAINFDSAENVTASYQCGLIEEDWREMTPDFSNAQQSRFIYRVAESGWRMSAVKFVFERQFGSVEEVLGAGNGKVLTFPLPHAPINLNVNAPFYYDGTLKVLAPIGQPITISYDYAGALPIVTNFLIGWEAKS